MRRTRELCLLLFAVVFVSAQEDDQADRDKQTFLIKYNHGGGIVPVSVRLDYKQRTEYVLNLSPHSKEKTVTFYDFNQRAIAFKDLSTQTCFIMRMKHENINKELKTLDAFRNEIISGVRPAVFYASGDSLSPVDLVNLAGPKVARFCYRTQAYIISSRRNRRRPKRQADDYSQRSYGHYGQQSQNYAHYGQETLSKGQGTPPSPPTWQPQPAQRRANFENGVASPGSYTFQGNQRSGYELYQPIGENGAVRSFGEYGTGYGQIPGFTGDPSQIAQLFDPRGAPSTPNFPTQEQVLRFPLPTAQSDGRSEDPRREDPRRDDPRRDDPRRDDPRRDDPRREDSRREDPRRDDPRREDPRREDQRREDQRREDQRREEQRREEQRREDQRRVDARYGSTSDQRYGGQTTDHDRNDPYRDNEGDSRHREAQTPDSTYSPHRGVASDSESGAGALALARGRNRFPLLNSTLPFKNFNTDATLTGTGIVSNTKVTVDNQGTNAVATSTGRLNEQRSQSQVQGNYAGSGSFAAQAQAGFVHGTTQSQVRGGSDGGSSLSSANVERLGSAQSQVQVGTPDGKSTGSAQGNFVRGGTQAEAQSSRDAGSASSQAQSPGLSQSSATVNNRGQGQPREKFLGELSASTRGDLHSGVSNTNLQGAFGADKTYSAIAEGSFNAQSSYNPQDGLTSYQGFDDRPQIPSDPRRGDTSTDYRYPTTRTPFDQQRQPDDRYPSTRSPYDQGRAPIDYRYVTTRSPYDQRVPPQEYRYTTTTTTTSAPYDPYARSDARRAGSSTGQDPYDGRRSPASVATNGYPQSDSQTNGTHPSNPYERRRQSIFPPYSPDPRLANKGVPTRPPYLDTRRSYAAPAQTKGQIFHPAPQIPPARSYVHADPNQQPQQVPQNKGYIPPSRSYVHTDPSQQEHQVPQNKGQVTPQRRTYVYADPRQQTKSATPQVSCCRTRRGQRDTCCQQTPSAECCNFDSHLPRREALRDSSDQQDDCQSKCFTVYKTIGQARICQPSDLRNC